jgi:hypothetical protein
MLDVSQTDDGLTYVWRIPGEPEQSGRVETLAELRKKHPQFTQTVLAPLTRRLGLRGLVRHHPAAEVYRAFPSVRPDDEAVNRVRDLLPRLGAPRASVRERASAELDRMGRPAVLAVLRLDRSALSPEQNVRLEMFLRSAGSAGLPAGAGGAASGRPAAEAEVDIDFLIDCLDDEDPNVRAAAKQQLEGALGRPVAFNPALTGEARSAAVDRLFEQIDRATPPVSSRGAARPTQNPTQNRTQ